MCVGISDVIRGKEITMNHMKRLALIAAIGTFALVLTVNRRVGLAVISTSVGLSAAAVSGSADNKETAVRSFRVDVSSERLADLRRRIASTKWPERETVTDATQGVRLQTMQKLA